MRRAPRLLAPGFTVMLLCSAPAWSAPADTPASTAATLPAHYPSEAEVLAAVAKLKTDPSLSASRKMRTLHWADQSEKPSDAMPGWLRWFAELFAWIAAAGRAVLWVAAAVVVGLLALYITRFLKARAGRGAAERFTAPTHVRDLDIRPETLPDDIDAAALELWDGGEHRGALALLYRGLLSRLAHVHGVPIRHSSTEGECVELAARHLSAGPAGYVSRLVRVWQRAVYGGQDPATDEVRRLCAGFAGALDPPSNVHATGDRTAEQTA